MATSIQVTGKGFSGENPEFVQRFLQAMSAAGVTKVNVSSGYRSRATNAAVGGVPNSNHLRGLAVDATAYIPGRGWVPAGQVPTVGSFGLRSGDQPGFYHGGRDPNHVDAGYMATGVEPRSGPAATAPPSNPIGDLIWRLAPQFGVDPRAALAVAAQEGLGGGVGDQGTSFGPFQLHVGGAYPSFAPQGNPQAQQAWAASPAGVSYALRQIGQKARGLTGNEAIRRIVFGFERPSNPAAEYQKAVAAYGGVQAPAASVPSSVGGTSAPSLAGFTQAIQSMFQPAPAMPNPNAGAARALAAIKPPATEAAPTTSATPVPSSVPGVPNALNYYDLVRALQ